MGQIARKTTTCVHATTSAGRPMVSAVGPARAQCEQPEPQPPAWASGAASPSAPSSTWKEWPQPHEEAAFGLSILNPDSCSPVRKSIVAPWRYGTLKGSTTTLTPSSASSRSPSAGCGVEPEAVLEAGAAAALDRDAQHHRVAVGLLGHQLADLRGGRRRDREQGVGGALLDLHAPDRSRTGRRARAGRTL